MHQKFRALGTVLIVQASLTGAAAGIVGVNDPCPLPTPYPPVLAGAGVANNPNMENGFTAGAANNWTSWRDATYTNQVHFQGTDHVFQGSASQRMDLKQPPSGYSTQEAGIYQQIWVVPGATYTATARIWLVPPPAQTYNGEDLVGWIGLDPFGQNNGDGSGTEWSVNAATPNTWITSTVTVKAVLPVMTLSLKGTRKFPQHGDSARIYFDQVTLSGPVPTGQRPGPEPDPVDPESLIPPTLGANLVGNASFEQPYSGGASAGWNKWSTAGTGQWKQSQRLGKVGPGYYDCGDLQQSIEMNGKTILLFGGNPENNPNDLGVMGNANQFAAHTKYQDAIFVGRPFIDSNGGMYFNSNTPTYWGRRFADQCKHLESLVPRIDCWQGLNEPDWGGQWNKVLEFERAFAQRCHELGIKSCSLNLSTGSPGNIWRMIDQSFSPSAHDLLDIADYLGHHVYGGPNDQLMVANQDRDDACSFALRPRRFKDMYDRRGWRFPPVIATEGSTYGGWIGNFTPDEIDADLKLMGAYMNADHWYAGYTNFAVGIQCNGAWRPWDLINQTVSGGQRITQSVGAWNADHPADAIDGLYSQMFGAGEVHPVTLSQLTPAGLFNGGVNRQITGLIPGEVYLVKCWMKYEFRGQQPTQLAFYVGVDPTGQTTDGSAGTINWGADQVADKARVHETFTHIWRTFTPSSPTASVWLRASHPTANPSFKCYVDLVEVLQVNDGPPMPGIGLSTTAINTTGTAGIDPPDDSFTVYNTGPGTLNYTISDNAGWLTVMPASGSSSGEHDTITVSYDVTGLPAATHNAQITITSPEASNSPQAITVQLQLASVGADFDEDGDVDLDDFGHLQGCFTGPGVPQTAPACQNARLDPDDDVDVQDFALFRLCLNGKSLPPAAACE